MYFELLEGVSDPVLIEMIENDQNYFQDQVIFQKDGVPAYYALPVYQYEHFPGYRIGGERFHRTVDNIYFTTGFLSACHSNNKIYYTNI